MISKILIANRGEISSRVAKTCRDLGIRSVAVYSDADAGLPFVGHADQAVRIGPAAVADSYLDAEAILDAAKRTGADAVHPGYGFLAENADFAQAVVDAGLTWIGPTPEAMRQMGDKSNARHLAKKAGVPTVPGFSGRDPSDEVLLKKAKGIGFPLMVKASAGGGGRGMRLVTREEDLPEALKSARREAEGAFGDGHLLLEKAIMRPRHIEVQVFGDSHGNVIHLGERECSIQRRHQKILEEAPSPAVDQDLRDELGEAAVQLASAIGYVGAGTCEFLLGDDDEFYFLEMNTRLQVEHPVTELITELDLVALQIKVANGEPLELEQEEVFLGGHSIEARLYAEDPNRDYLPSTGPLHRMDYGWPGTTTVPGVRIDTGYASGTAVSPHYDAMIAKLIVWGEDRAQALAKLARLLEEAWVPGIVTNLPLLREISRHEAWLEGDLHTGFLTEHGMPSPPPLDPVTGILGALALGHAERRGASVYGGHVPAGWRPWGPAEQRESFSVFGEEHAVTWTADGDELTAHIGDESHAITVGARDGDRLTVIRDGVRSQWRVCRVSPGKHDNLGDGDTVYVHTGEIESMAIVVPRFPAPAGAEAEPGSCVAPTPGTVVAVHVSVGDEVTEGQALIALEAMKMEQTLAAPEAGTVAEVRVVVGDAVDGGQLLVRIEPAEG
ncbi:MAG: ATP-grasp domain-containing protein [Deltaproteobacteria bacterium]|nr:MAG: ATP-grasp domain-containing protein [Deltaproteobacteria bacterium]